MLSNQPLDKMHSVNQSLFTTAMGAGTQMKMTPKIGIQQNQFNRVRAVPQNMSSAKTAPRSTTVMQAGKNEHFVQIQEQGAQIMGNIS